MELFWIWKEINLEPKREDTRVSDKKNFSFPFSQFILFFLDFKLKNKTNSYTNMYS